MMDRREAKKRSARARQGARAREFARVFGWEGRAPRGDTWVRYASEREGVAARVSAEAERAAYAAWEGGSKSEGERACHLRALARVTLSMLADERDFVRSGARVGREGAAGIQLDWDSERAQDYAAREAAREGAERARAPYTYFVSTRMSARERRVAEYYRRRFARRER